MCTDTTNKELRLSLSFGDCNFISHQIILALVRNKNDMTLQLYLK